ncbi:hypothetical protein QBC41DRAFT_307969 [Cercophora samala]|uniref:F-box domain-containing protein n=1 Tax=Cercophora samala TaxID=330535 RepID=A0AA39YVQ3_9PEZI|nr:hypothetical protein QBC41DRAFT_307969 [Cercophora samala]
MATPEETAAMTPPPAPTAQVAPPPPTPTLSTLAPELLLHILEAITSTTTLVRFLQACPPAWRVYVKHSQPLLLRLARYRYSKPGLTADDIISYKAPFELPFMQLITNDNCMSILTPDCPGSLDHSRCEKVYLLMGGGGPKGREEWVQLPRGAELVERWDRAWEGKEEKKKGRLTLKRVRYYGEMTRFAVGWERWMSKGEVGGRSGSSSRAGARKVNERMTEMQCLEGHEETMGKRGRKELGWGVTVQRRAEYFTNWGGGGEKKNAGRGDKKAEQKEKKPVVKATVKKEEKRKVEEKPAAVANKKVKVEKAVPAVEEAAQENGNGEVRIKPDPDNELMPMPPPKTKPLPRFKLEEDDW